MKGTDVDQLAKVANGVEKQLVKEAAIAYATAKNSMEFHGLQGNKNANKVQAIDAYC